MQHYQKQISCTICERVFIVDIVSIGSPLQSVEAVTCLECVPEPDKLLGDREWSRSLHDRMSLPEGSITKWPDGEYQTGTQFVVVSTVGGETTISVTDKETITGVVKGRFVALPNQQVLCEGCLKGHRLALIVPDEVWERINDGKNILCPVCIVTKLEAEFLGDCFHMFHWKEAMKLKKIKADVKESNDNTW